MSACSRIFFFEIILHAHLMFHVCALFDSSNSLRIWFSWCANLAQFSYRKKKFLVFQTSQYPIRSSKCSYFIHFIHIFFMVMLSASSWYPLYFYVFLASTWLKNVGDAGSRSSVGFTQSTIINSLLFTWHSSPMEKSEEVGCWLHNLLYFSNWFKT